MSLRPTRLRPVEIWLPDVDAAGFVAEAQRQAALVSRADQSDDDLDFVEAVSVDWDE